MIQIIDNTQQNNIENCNVTNEYNLFLINTNNNMITKNNEIILLTIFENKYNFFSKS